MAYGFGINRERMMIKDLMKTLDKNGHGAYEVTINDFVISVTEKTGKHLTVKAHEGNYIIKSSGKEYKRKSINGAVNNIDEALNVYQTSMKYYYD